MAYRHAKDTVNIHLYSTTLENPEAVPPVVHVFHGERLAWLNIEDDLRRYDKMPG